MHGWADWVGIPAIIIALWGHFKSSTHSVPEGFRKVQHVTGVAVLLLSFATNPGGGLFCCYIALKVFHADFILIGIMVIINIIRFF